jgi:hypothetical protein
LQNSPLESSCVVVARIENYSTSKPLKLLVKNHRFLVVTLLLQMSDMAAKRNAYRVLGGKTEGEGSLGRLRTGWEVNIKMGLEEI